jgi:hypothetical protein
MCQTLTALPGESFVDRAQRWIEGLRFTAGLQPRDQQEWLQAADITTKQFGAVYSLVMQRRKGATARQRAKFGQDYVFQIKAVHEARLRYDLLRSSRTG